MTIRMSNLLLLFLNCHCSPDTFSTTLLLNWTENGIQAKERKCNQRPLISISLMSNIFSFNNIYPPVWVERQTNKGKVWLLVCWAHGCRMELLWDRPAHILPLRHPHPKINRDYRLIFLAKKVKKGGMMAPFRIRREKWRAPQKWTMHHVLLSLNFDWLTIGPLLANLE
jgi:hypothetical protein